MQKKIDEVKAKLGITTDETKPNTEKAVVGGSQHSDKASKEEKEARKDLTTGQNAAGQNIEKYTDKNGNRVVETYTDKHQLLQKIHISKQTNLKDVKQFSSQLSRVQDSTTEKKFSQTTKETELKNGLTKTESASAKHTKTEKSIILN